MYKAKIGSKIRAKWKLFENYTSLEPDISCPSATEHSVTKHKNVLYSMHLDFRPKFSDKRSRTFLIGDVVEPKKPFVDYNMYSRGEETTNTMLISQAS